MPAPDTRPGWRFDTATLIAACGVTLAAAAVAAARGAWWPWGWACLAMYAVLWGYAWMSGRRRSQP
jgi:hypothetical protein